jgi:hypothetical protein
MLKIILYFGAMVILFLVVLSFNTLRIVKLDGLKTIQTARIRFKLDSFEFQIKDALNDYSKAQKYNYRQIQVIDDLFFSYDQQIEGLKLPKPDSIKNNWENLKKEGSFNTSLIIKELEQLHNAINQKTLDDFIIQEGILGKDISGLNTIKKLIGFLAIVMVFVAMYLDTIQRKQTKEMLRKLIDSDKKQMT